MKAYSAMNSEEFIWQLRQSLIRAKVPPLVIDQVDQLRGIDDDEPEMEKLQVELDEMEQELSKAQERIEQLESELDDALRERS